MTDTEKGIKEIQQIYATLSHSKLILSCIIQYAEELMTDLEKIGGMVIGLEIYYRATLKENLELKEKTKLEQLLNEKKK